MADLLQDKSLAIKFQIMVEIIEQGADDHINRLSHKYRGQDYVFTPGQVRVIYKIRPDNVDAKD